MPAMNLGDLNTWLDYHYWARDVILEAVEPLSAEQFTRPIESSFKSVRDTVAHMYGAEWLWYDRWIGNLSATMPKYDSWPDVVSIRKAWLDHEIRLRTFVNDGGEAGVDRIYNYKSLAGQTIANIYDYTYALDVLKIGQPSKVVFMRGGERKETTLTPAARK